MRSWRADCAAFSLPDVLQVELDLKRLQQHPPLEEQLSVLLRMSLSLPGNPEALNVMRQYNGVDLQGPAWP